MADLCAAGAAILQRVERFHAAHLIRRMLFTRIDDGDAVDCVWALRCADMRYRSHEHIVAAKSVYAVAVRNENRLNVVGIRTDQIAPLVLRSPEVLLTIENVA